MLLSPDPVVSVRRYMHELTCVPRDIHVFEHNGALYGFDPVTVRLRSLEPDEASFLKAFQNTNALDAGSSLGWEPDHTKEVVENLFQKGLLSCSYPEPAEKAPPSDRVEVLVNASQICNLACAYCFVDQGKFSYPGKRAEKLSPDHARRLIEVLPEGLPWVEEFCIHFYGGEPLLNLEAMKAAVDAADAAEGDTRFTFAITTNGTIVTEEAVSLLKKGHFCVVLSMDGPPEVHDAVRRTVKGEPTHARVMKFLQLLRMNPPLSVRGSAVVRKGWTLNQAEKYLNAQDITLIKAQAVRLPLHHPLMLDKKERTEYVNHLGEIADDVINGLQKGKAPRDDRFGHRVLQVLRGTRRTSFCGAGQWTFGVAADGTILPCVLLAGREGMVLGHLDEPPEKWVKRGKAWAEANGPRTECEHCWALPLCGGGCPAMLNICGEDECDLTRANCEKALAIYGAFYPDNLVDLLYLAGL